MSEMTNIVDETLAADGLERIGWARQFMPAIADAGKDIGDSGVIEGRRVGVVLTLEPKTAVLALTLSEAGADVSVYCDPSSTTDSIAAALASRGLRVYARSDADPEMDAMLLDRFIDDRIEFLIDDGAGCTRRMHTTRSDALETLVGVAEETTSGVRPLRVMEQVGALRVPCVAVNDSRAKQLFDNVYGTGQSVVMSVIDNTNTQLQGKTVVVVGYGYVGSGIARAAHALGARIIVTEIDPIKALQALHDGYDVMPLDDACASGDVFITATGIGYSLTGEHARLMKDGALLAVGGAGRPEIDLFGVAGVEVGDEVRRHVRRVTIDDDRSVFLIADGHCSNIAAGEGNSIEIMDLSLAVQCRAVQYLAENAATLGIAVHDVPASVDLAVATSALADRGVAIDVPSSAQIRHASSWNTTNNNGEEV